MQTSCQKELAKAGKLPLVGRYIPQCKEDGSWHEVQCHGSTGYCWCVDQEGKKLLGTKVHAREGRLPNCTKPGNLNLNINNFIIFNQMLT